MKQIRTPGYKPSSLSINLKSRAILSNVCYLAVLKLVTLTQVDCEGPGIPKVWCLSWETLSLAMSSGYLIAEMRTLAEVDTVNL